jgi:predicted permease
MGDKTFLLARVGTASLIGALGLFTLVFVSARFGLFTLVFASAQFKVGMTGGAERLLAAIWVCIPFGIAIWWVFRQLKTRYSKREAKAVTIAFAVFNPVSLCVSLVLAQLGGSIVGALICTVAISTLLSFAVCLAALRMTRHIEKIETAL